MGITRREFLDTIDTEPDEPPMAHADKEKRVARSTQKLEQLGFLVNRTLLYDTVILTVPRSGKSRTFRLEGENYDLLVLPGQVVALSMVSYDRIARQIGTVA